MNLRHGITQHSAKALRHVTFLFLYFNEHHSVRCGLCVFGLPHTLFGFSEVDDEEAGKAPGILNGTDRDQSRTGRSRHAERDFTTILDLKPQGALGMGSSRTRDEIDVYTSASTCTYRIKQKFRP